MVRIKGLTFETGMKTKSTEKQKVKTECRGKKKKKKKRKTVQKKETDNKVIQK